MGRTTGSDADRPAKLGREGWAYSVAGMLEELALDKPYIPTQYPNAHHRGAPRYLYTRGEAERSVGYAARILGFCEDLLAAL